MTLRLSTAARNMQVGPLGLQGAFAKFVVDVYSGAQPASGDAAATGTKLGTYSLASGAVTEETLAAQTITVSGSSGSIDGVTVGTLSIINAGVPFNTSAAQTASDLCDAINAAGIATATVAGAVVTVRPRPGVGDAWNGKALATSVTTLTATSGGNMTGGVDAVNMLSFAKPAAGVLAKPGGQQWSFNGIAAGTAGWFRVRTSGDTGALDSTGTWPRIDGNIATSGADMNLSNTTIAVGAPTTLDALQFTMPAQ